MTRHAGVAVTSQRGGFSGFAHAADPGFSGFLLIFDLLCGFWGPGGVPTAMLQMGSGRALDDFKMPRSGTRTITHFSNNHVFEDSL